MRRLLLLLLAVAGCDERGQEPPLTRGVTAEEHQGYFPISAGAPHALGVLAQDGSEINCTSCHAGTPTFETSLCRSCHLADTPSLVFVHALVVDPLPVDDALCLGCHLDGNRVPRPPEVDAGPVEPGVDAGPPPPEPPRITHEDWFPIGPESLHGNATYVARRADIDGPAVLENECRACHVSTVLEERAQVLCLECHLRDETDIEEAHGSAGSLADRELLFNSYDLATTPPRDPNIGCKECHAEVPINEAVRPVDDHEDAGGIKTDHHQATCTQCHQSKLPEPREWGIDFRASSCVCCHTAPTCTGASQDTCSGTASLVCPP